MTTPSSPAEMQAHVLAQLVKHQEKEPKQESKAPMKFAKSLGGNIETRLRDRIFHEAGIEAVETSETKYLSFTDTSSNTSPISIFWDTNNLPAAILRCDKVMAALLARLCYGGDIESEVLPSNNKPTAAELGLLQIFSDFVARSMEKMDVVSITNTTTVGADEFEADELPNTVAIMCKFTVQIGATQSTMELAIPESVIKGAADDLENDGVLSSDTSNDEFMHASIDASVKLKPLPTTLKKVRSLKVGDRLPLGNNGPLEGQFLVNGQEVFNCAIGRSGETYSLKISDQNNAVKNKSYSQLLVG